jgi:competence protein ComEC
MSETLHSVIAILRIYVREPYVSLLAGITYGISVNITPQLTEQIQRSGLTHLIVLSGANITSLLFLIERMYVYIGKRTGLCVYLMFVLGFTHIVGMQPPIFRATLMFIFSVICHITGRPVYSMWNLWLSIFFTALLHPNWIDTRSFQLSVAATASLIMGSRLLDRHHIKRTFLYDVLLSLSIFICTLPLCALYFRSISLISPFATACAGLLVAPLMIGGLLLPLIHFISSSLAIIFSLPLTYALMLLHELITYSSSIPYLYITW